MCPMEEIDIASIGDDLTTSPKPEINFVINKLPVNVQAWKSKKDSF